MTRDAELKTEEPGQCIYCRRETNGTEGRAHVVPEAIAKNEMVLPLGTVCDPCNNYLGQLDSVLATHPMLAFAIQCFALPGKTGKARSLLGKFAQSSSGGAQSVTLQPEAAQQIAEVNGKSLLVLEPLRGEAMRRFHRSLYHVGFNTLCFFAGAGVALEQDFDPVRRYIRQPRKGEIWPYFHAPLGGKPVDIVEVFFRPSPALSILRFFNQIFAVYMSPTENDSAELSAFLPKLVWSKVSGRRDEEP